MRYAIKFTLRRFALRSGCILCICKFIYLEITASGRSAEGSAPVAVSAVVRSAGANRAVYVRETVALAGHATVLIQACD